MKKNKIYGLAVIVLGMFATSCSDWLDVKPKTAVNEEDLYSRELGFKEALTGIYIQMSNKALYGRELSYGITDILAQRYEPGGGSDKELTYTNPDWYKFPSVKTETYVNSIWGKMYNTIANINNLLAWTEKNKAVISTPGYYGIIRGEALGLRAFLYFDLLRLYGPIYGTPGGPSSPSLPYRTEFSRDDKSLATAEQLLLNIEKDLLEAELLLKDDPMYIDFPQAASDQSKSQDEFLMYRFKRMNRYAVKALLARMYLWKGNAGNAAKYASEVIDGVDKDGNNHFTLVTDNSVDRIFSSELIFSLSVDKFDEQVDVDFKISPYTTTYYLNDKKRLDEMFDVKTDGFNDMRFREGQGFQSSSTSTVCSKYDQRGMFSFALKNTAPLIRLSEMYYILAECETDLREAANLLSQVRAARGIDDIETFRNAEDKEFQIMKEYRKEFYAEGQLWFYYKRHGYKTFQHCPLEIDMTEANYRFSIPDNEKELGHLY